MRDTTRLAQLEYEQEQRDLLHPMKQTGRFDLPVPGE